MINREQLRQTNVLIMGREGTSKSTQMKLFSEATGIPGTSTGDLVRAYVQNDQSYLGDACRSALAKNEYVEPVVVGEIIGSWLQTHRSGRGVVLDGVGRSVTELSLVSNLLRTYFPDTYTYALFLELDRRECFRRLRKRGRSDDSPLGIYRRFRSYESGLSDRIAYIDTIPNWIRASIDATGTKEEIHARVLSAVGVLV